MATVNDVLEFLCEFAPLEYQLSFDNSGFQLGNRNKEAEIMLLALDVTDEVADEAAEKKADLIISHHPLLFDPPRSIDESEPSGRIIAKLIRNGISVISMHTNLDITAGGVNDVLIRKLGAEPEASFDAEGCGRAGYLKEPCDIDDFLKYCKEKLKVKGLRYVAPEKRVRKLAVLGGAGADALSDAYKMGCDTFVTADIKYHQFLQAQAMGINLIDADHFCTENPVMYELRAKLKEAFPTAEISVSERHSQIINFI